MIEPWDARIAPNAVFIAESRKEFIKDFLPVFMKVIQRNLWGRIESVSLEYISNVSEGDEDANL